jgi:crotonobetainyl-CoA:carnitine CoA-transferase CaiB-like acyl-CoA transferase
MGIGACGGYRGESSVKIGQSYPDFLAAWSGLTLIMAALVHRQRTGEGQWLDLGMYQLGVPVIPEALIAVQAGQPDPGCRGNEDWGAAYSAVLPAAGHEQWLVVSAADAGALRRLDAVLGLGDAPPAAVRDEALRGWARARSPQAGAQALQAAGVAAAPVNDARDLVCDPHLKARGFLEDVDFGPGIGHRPLIGRPYTWEGSGCTVRGPAPHYGADNRAVLGGVLGLSDEAIEALYAAGVVADRPSATPQVEPEDLAALVAAGNLREADVHYREVVERRSR